MNKHLVILSIPHVRVVRLLLSDNILTQIKKHSDILIVTPFATEQRFQDDFKGENIFFHKFDTFNLGASKLMKKLYAVSEIMRKYGFYRRSKKKGTSYPIKNITRNYGVDGSDTIDPLAARLMKRTLSYIGFWRGSWRVLDRLSGASLFQSEALEAFTSKYQKVTLIQAASWGVQDRVLAWHARRLKFRSVLIPYTTDQISINGYLMCNYDAVCVQGAFEAWCSKEYHNVPGGRIVPLGSMWFRNIDQLLLSNPNLKRTQEENAPTVIMYAGLARLYSPQANEFRVVDRLIAANEEGLLGHAKLVYRPGAMTEEERAPIKARYDQKNIELQWPAEACGGLDSYSGAVEKGLLDLLENLLGTDILIMAQITSLALEAAYMGCSVIADFTDEGGLLKERQRHRFLSKHGEIPSMPGVPVVHSLADLMTQIRKFQTDKEASKQSTDGILRQWDYCQPDWEKLLSKAVYNEMNIST